MTTGRCPRCGGETISTARQDDVCLNDDCGYAGAYYPDAHSKCDHANADEIHERNDNVAKGGGYYD